MVDLCDLFVYQHPWSRSARGLASAFDDTLPVLQHFMFLA